MARQHSPRSNTAHMYRSREWLGDNELPAFEFLRESLFPGYGVREVGISENPESSGRNLECEDGEGKIFHVAVRSIVRGPDSWEWSSGVGCRGGSLRRPEKGPNQAPLLRSLNPKTRWISVRWHRESVRVPVLSRRERPQQIAVHEPDAQVASWTGRESIAPRRDSGGISERQNRFRLSMANVLASWLCEAFWGSWLFGCKLLLGVSIV